MDYILLCSVEKKGRACWFLNVILHRLEELHILIRQEFIKAIITLDQYLQQ